MRNVEYAVNISQTRAISRAERETIDVTCSHSMHVQLLAVIVHTKSGLQ